jgi:hypothetical protein
MSTEIIELWINKHCASERSKKTYRYDMNDFLEYAKTDAQKIAETWNQVRYDLRLRQEFADQWTQTIETYIHVGKAVLSPKSIVGNFAFRVVYHLADSVVLNPENFMRIDWTWTDIEVKRVSTVISNGYMYPFSELNTGQTFVSDDMYMTNPGTINAHRYPYFSRADNLPAGYEVKIYYWNPSKTLWNPYSNVDLYTGNQLKWTFEITNVSGSVSADFTGFRIYFEI